MRGLLKAAAFFVLLPLAILILIAIAGFLYGIAIWIVGLAQHRRNP
jgi:hypothetical protein